jgi:hypothetical protein
MRENVIAYNRLSDISNVLQDSGAIYTLSLQPGTKIAGNVIESIVQGHAIYLDEASGGTEQEPFVVENNVLGERGHIHKNVPGLLVVRNNHATITETEQLAGLQARYREITHQFHKNVSK